MFLFRWSFGVLVRGLFFGMVNLKVFAFFHAVQVYLSIICIHPSINQSFPPV